MRLYEEAPEGVNLLLAQTVFEKIWILDAEVAGVELVQPIAEVLTVEARLALAEQDGADSSQEGQSAGEEAKTYYRRARGIDALLGGLEAKWGTYL